MKAARARTTKVTIGDSSDLNLALAPLSKVSKQIAAQLITEGNSDKCGDCDKPFTAARKWRGVVRLVTTSDAGLAACFYLVCGKCRAASEQRHREGGSVVAEHWLAESKHVHEAGQLLKRPEYGNA